MTIYQYWGKKSPSENDSDIFHLLPYHSLDVAAVCKAYLSNNKSLLTDLSLFLSIEKDELISLLCFFFALHDLGKFASAFQGLAAPCNALIQPDQKVWKYDSTLAKHDRLGAYFWQINDENILELIMSDADDEEDALDSIEILMNVVLGHHGHPISLDTTRELKRYTEKRNNDDVNTFINSVYDIFKPTFPQHWCDEGKEPLAQISWHLSGIMVLADWLGSNRDYFPYVSETMPLDVYWSMAVKQAEIAIQSSGLLYTATPSPFLSVQHHFGFNPTPLQTWAENVCIDNSPQLFILEDVTGAGKTEAALSLTHRLMAEGAAEGFYFGLPTMATSNAMFTRIANFYSQMFNASKDNLAPSIVLAHGARDMNAQFEEIKITTSDDTTTYADGDTPATAFCNAWFADSKKKALLAPVGVGTIDQALLAVLPKYHQTLRLLGLHRKVLIFDEVHSADDFMFTLLRSLLQLHLRQGGSAILLTATLSQEKRQQLTNIWLNAAHLPNHVLQKTGFPLATHVQINNEIPVKEYSVESRKEVSRRVEIEELHSMDACFNIIISAVENNQCIVWIRNSVDDAKEAFTNVVERLRAVGLNRVADEAMLFHSRFTLQDRNAIEANVLACFGKKGSDSNPIDGKIREGKILIATQVFQESLDADADVMITDICPIDDKIQRAGRLHRHTRNKEGTFYLGVDQRSAPILYIHCPEWTDAPKLDWLTTDFINTEYVYRSPGRLWLALKIIKKLGAITMPKDARTLIENVYSQDALDGIPTTLIEKERALISDQLMKISSASFQLIDFKHNYCDLSSKFWAEDQYDVSTRFQDCDIDFVLVLRRNNAGNLILWAGDIKNAVQLSLLKLPTKKYIEKLILINDEQKQLLINKYPQSRYLKMWLPESDPEFNYSSDLGFHCCDI